MPMAIRVEIEDGRIEVEGSDFAELVLAYGARISNDGVLVETDQDVPVGQSVKFLMRLADGSVLVRAVGVVGGRHGGAAGRHGGLMIGFVNIEEGHALIQRIMDHHQLESDGGSRPDDAPEDSLPGAVESGYRADLASLPAASTQPDGVTLIQDDAPPGFAPGMLRDGEAHLARGDMPGREILESLDPPAATAPKVDISSLLGDEPASGPDEPPALAGDDAVPAATNLDPLLPQPAPSLEAVGAEAPLEPHLDGAEPLLPEGGSWADAAFGSTAPAGVESTEPGVDEDGARGWGGVLADTEESSPWEVRPPSDFVPGHAGEDLTAPEASEPLGTEGTRLDAPLVPEPLGVAEDELAASEPQPVSDDPAALASSLGPRPRSDPMADATWLLESWKRDESDSVAVAREKVRVRPPRTGALRGLTSALWPLLAIGLVVAYLAVQRLYEPAPVIGALPAPAPTEEDGVSPAASPPPLTLADLRAARGPVTVEVQPGALRGAPVTLIERVTWVRSGEQTRILVWGDGAFDPAAISWERDADANRDTIRIRDILSAHQPDRYDVSTPEVSEVVLGYRQEGVERELTITVVAARSDLRLTAVSIERGRMALIVG